MEYGKDSWNYIDQIIQEKETERTEQLYSIYFYDSIFQ